MSARLALIWCIAAMSFCIFLIKPACSARSGAACAQAGCCCSPITSAAPVRRALTSRRTFAAVATICDHLMNIASCSSRPASRCSWRKIVPPTLSRFFSASLNNLKLANFPQPSAQRWRRAGATSCGAHARASSAGACVWRRNLSEENTVDLQLAGKVAIVSGASRGIGRAIAQTLAAEGMQLVLAARSRDQLNELAASLGVDCLVQAVDLRAPDAPEAVVAAAIARFGQLDLLVNNAGATTRGDFLSLTDASWEDGFALKFYGAMRCSRAAWPHLCARRGSIVN